MGEMVPRDREWWCDEEELCTMMTSGLGLRYGDDFMGE